MYSDRMPGLEALAVELRQRTRLMVDPPPELLQDIAGLLKIQKLAELRAGVNYLGRPYPKLAASTLRRRKGTGPPLSPQQAGSRVQTRLVVRPTRGFSFTQYWTDMGWLRHHSIGGPKLPKREPGGVSETARRHALAYYSQRIQHVSRWPWMRRQFGRASAAAFGL